MVDYASQHIIDFKKREWKKKFMQLKKKIDFTIQINYNLDNLSFLFLTFMPKLQSGCEKQFRASWKKYSPALIKLNFIKAAFLPSDQLQWMIQGF